MEDAVGDAGAGAEGLGEGVVVRRGEARRVRVRLLLLLLLSRVGGGQRGRCRRCAFCEVGLGDDGKADGDSCLSIYQRDHPNFKVLCFVL